MSSVLRLATALMAALLLVLPAAAADGIPGMVRTADGNRLEGSVAVTTNGFLVATGSGDPTVLSLDQVIEVSLQAEEPAAAAAPEPATSGPEPVAGGWAGTAIGVAQAGTVVVEEGALKVTGAGRGLQGNSDAFFFAHQRLDSSGQVAGRILATEGTAPEAVGGLMLRDNLGESAAYAFIGYRTGSGLCFQYRQIASGMTMRVTNFNQPPPVWVRLGRVGGAVTAEWSADGRKWDVLGRANVNLGQSVRAGMAVAPGVDDQLAFARFGQATLGARGGGGYVPATGYPRLHFRGGSMVIAPIESGDESVLRLGGPLKGGVVSVANLARIEFQPLTPDLEARLDPARVGVLLSEGDFLDGTLRSIQTNTITVGSLLFGFRRFTAGNEVAVAQLGPVVTDETSYQVTLRNGSVLRARRLELLPGSVRAESPQLGALVVGMDQVREVRRAAVER